MLYYARYILIGGIGLFIALIFALIRREGRGGR